MSQQIIRLEWKKVLAVVSDTLRLILDVSATQTT
jgi:hypothetical protein